MGMVVWNDYEEGTALEPGIDNCYSVNTPTVSGPTLNWGITASSNEASTSTIDHYSVWLLDGSGNAQDILDVPGGSSTAATLPNTIPTGTWSIRVQMIGVNSVQNRLSGALTYIK